MFEQAIAQKPDFAEAWVNKGATLMELGRSEEAIEAFDQAIALNENLPEAWSNRGKALWQLRRFEEGLASVDRALKIQPDSPAALKLQQQMRQRLGGS
ncbi:MAG: tetratricopeptide repeat protein [Leptolyngbyaceae cyanobacterium SM1_3_5]|nr:tetratricopeptide repeat protein [Leptolyngbyaceae cyanobacterium SM1_3_5]